MAAPITTMLLTLLASTAAVAAPEASPSPSPLSPSPAFAPSPGDESGPLSPSSSPPLPAPTPAPLASSPAPGPDPDYKGGDVNVIPLDEEGEDKKKAGMSGGKMAGIAIGVLLGEVAVAVGAFVYKKHRKNIRRSYYGGYRGLREII